MFAPLKSSCLVKAIKTEQRSKSSFHLGYDLLFIFLVAVLFIGALDQI